MSWRLTYRVPHTRAFCHRPPLALIRPSQATSATQALNSHSQSVAPTPKHSQTSTTAAKLVPTTPGQSHTQPRESPCQPPRPDCHGASTLGATTLMLTTTAQQSSTLLPTLKQSQASSTTGLNTQTTTASKVSRGSTLAANLPAVASKQSQLLADEEEPSGGGEVEDQVDQVGRITAEVRLTPQLLVYKLMYFPKFDCYEFTRHDAGCAVKQAAKNTLDARCQPSTTRAVLLDCLCLSLCNMPPPGSRQPCCPLPLKQSQASSTTSSTTDVICFEFAPIVHVVAITFLA